MEVQISDGSEIVPRQEGWRIQVADGFDESVGDRLCGHTASEDGRSGSPERNAILMINAIAITACLLTMVSSYLVAQGQLKRVYVIGVINGTLYVILNGAIAIADPSQMGVMVLIIPSGWGVAMAIIGLRRLEKEKKCSR
jgi:hypothetical protein